MRSVEIKRIYTFNAVSPYSDEYVKEYCSNYYNKIADLIKIEE